MPRCPAGAASFALFAFALFILPLDVPAEQLAGPALPPDGKLTVIERSDLRTYENGKYIGLENREVRGILTWTKAPEENRRVEIVILED